MNKKKERTKILNRILLLKALHHVDIEGNVILNKRYMFPDWIDCNSCKYRKNQDINFYPMNCSRKINGKDEIGVAWKNTKIMGWICLVHEFEENEQ